ncbi:MAG: DUF1080 domain-containing protein [Kiritimatiellaeota bacterium]|nr:DUF1080 domain-containing protein [Kiritimatiellota bacterium]
MKSYSTLFTLTLLCAALVAHAQTSEAELIAKLKSEASLNERVMAAHTLGQIGTKAAIAPLAELLDNAEMHHAARYGLVMIPDPAVDEVFRAAAGKLQGKLLVGVLQSMGDRRDAAATPILAKCLGAGDKMVADAAAVSLGKIGTADAAKALKPLLGKSEAAARAYIYCAEKNTALYADILAAGDAVTPKIVRTAALRGNLLAKGLKRADFESKDPDAVDIALRVAYELPKSDAVQKVLVEALQAVPLIREQLCAVIAERGEQIPLPLLREILKDGTPSQQIAAIKAVTRVGMAAAIPEIATLAMSDDRGIASEAQALLGCFPESPQRTAALNELLSSPDAKRQQVGIGVAMQIRDKGAIPALLKLAVGEDNAVSDAAFKALGDITALEHFDALIVALQAKPSSDTAVRAVMSLCSRQVAPNANIEIRKAIYGSKEQNKTVDITDKVAAQVKAGAASFPASNALAGGDPANGVVKSLYLTYAVEGVEKQVTVKENETVTFENAGIPAAVLKPLNDAYAKAKGDAKTALLRVYSAFGNKQALDVICAAANQDANAPLKEAAMRLLFESKSLETLPALEDILKQPAIPDRMKTLALRAYKRLLDNSDLAPGMKIAYLTKLNGVLTRDEDRKDVQSTIADELKPGQDETGFASMFNGKDLTGWDSKQGWWSVRDGLLVGESTPDKPCTKNDHLIWTGGKPGDFEIRCDFRLSKSANSGIQLRSEAVADRDTGYQADCNGTGEYVGFLYHPAMHLVGGRGECTTLAPDGEKSAWRFADSNELQKLYKIEDWNTYRVVCKGSEISIYLNGVLTCHFIDYRGKPSGAPNLSGFAVYPKGQAPKNGAITLQMHAGPPMKIEYRNLRIKVMDK